MCAPRDPACRITRLRSGATQAFAAPAAPAQSRRPAVGDPAAGSPRPAEPQEMLHEVKP